MDDKKVSDRPGPPDRTWSNFFSGLIWLAIGWVLVVACQMIAVIILGAIETRRRGTRMSEADTLELLSDGDIIGIGFPLATVAVVAIVAVVVNVRRERSIVEYLALNPLPVGALTRWLWVAALLLAANIIVDTLLGRPDVPEWLEIAFITADYNVAFFLGMVIFAPVLEEVLYRGYVLRAWLESRLRPGAAVVLLSALWAFSHLQYDLYDMSWIFIFGLLLAYSRIRSGSLYPAIAIHCAWNLVSFIALVMNSDTQVHV